MAGTAVRAGIAAALVFAVAVGPGAAADAAAADPTQLPALRRIGSARFVAQTTTTRNHRRVVLHSLGVVDFQRRLGQRTTRPRGVEATETRTLGADFYYRGAPGSPTPHGRPWTHVRSDFVPDQSVQDPADLLRGFRPSRPVVRGVGAANVRGVGTTHYRLTSSVSVAPKLRTAGLVGYQGHTDVWVDRRGHVRRLRLETSAGEGSAASVTVTDYFDLGLSVHVDRPPAGEVTEGYAPDPQRGTGPSITIGSGTADDVAWNVRRIPTDHGSCTNLEADHRDQPYGARIRGSRLLGSPCVPTLVGDAPEFDLALDVLRNGAQIVSGVVPDGTTGATVHFDDGSTRDVAPRDGGIAFAIVGNRIAPTIVVRARDGNWTCSLSAVIRSYSCSRPATFGDATGPTIDTTP